MTDLPVSRAGEGADDRTAGGTRRPEIRSRRCPPSAPWLSCSAPSCAARPREIPVDGGHRVLRHGDAQLPDVRVERRIEHALFRHLAAEHDMVRAQPREQMAERGLVEDGMPCPEDEKGFVVRRESSSGRIGSTGSAFFPASVVSMISPWWNAIHRNCRVDDGNASGAGAVPHSRCLTRGPMGTRQWPGPRENGREAIPRDPVKEAVYPARNSAGTTTATKRPDRHALAESGAGTRGRNAGTGGAEA